MTASAPVARRRNPLWPLLGALLIVAAACLISNAAFEVSRGPSECGGDAAACPEGFVFGLLAGVGSVFLIAPIGVVLLTRALPNAILIALTLCFGGAAAGCYVAGFVADPVTDSTAGYWVGTGILGVLALLLLWPALRLSVPAHGERLPTAVAEAERREAAARAAKPTANAPRASVSGSVKISGSPAIGDLHDLLAHGLANGQLATDGAKRSTDPNERARVTHLIDLHRRGTLDDDDLLNALQALRDARSGGTTGKA